MKHFGLMAALALVVVVNVIVLASVRYNRSGEPDAVVTLTERELHLLTNIKENSGVSLKLELQSDHNKWSEVYSWFDQKKLEEVGFDCNMPVDAKDASHRYDKELPRRTYAVLEYEGKAWTAWLAGREEQLRVLEAQVAEGREGTKSLDEKRKRSRWEMAAGSRLFAVDVGNDAARLRQQYPDRTKYIITPALVRLRPHLTADTQKLQKPELSGYVSEVLTSTIHVPRDRQGIVASLKPEVNYFYYGGQKDNFTPRYRVTLNYGRRYEPWVAGVIAK